ncbi:unnamed protein product [Phytophthora lilii]|uniref:Unnamed protein product n=1 Tax=Phytophthora lilii TaxID=2077276 RepID=A0A9W6WZS8_9STRA|nr:unnamed protein product [Phytophthora lilii]
MPQDIVSDRNNKFISGFWGQVFEDVGTKLKMTVAYRAQGDGQMERTNRTLEEYLRCFVSPHQDNWDVHLANAEFAINSAVYSSIKMSPFEADLGYVPANPLSVVAAARRRGLQGGRRHGVKFTEHQAAVLHQCQDALEDAQAHMADVYDKGRKEQVFKVGAALQTRCVEQPQLNEEQHSKQLTYVSDLIFGKRHVPPKVVHAYIVVRAHQLLDHTEVKCGGPPVEHTNSECTPPKPSAIIPSLFGRARYSNGGGVTTPPSNIQSPVKAAVYKKQVNHKRLFLQGQESKEAQRGG